MGEILFVFPLQQSQIRRNEIEIILRRGEIVSTEFLGELFAVMFDGLMDHDHVRDDQLSVLFRNEFVLNIR